MDELKTYEENPMVNLGKQIACASKKSRKHHQANETF